MLLGRKGANPRFGKMILQAHGCLGQTQSPQQGMLPRGRQGVALPSPQHSPASGMRWVLLTVPPALLCSTRVLPRYQVGWGCPVGLYLLSPALAT